jgi:hypothetical protein
LIGLFVIVKCISHDKIREMPRVRSPRLHNAKLRATEAAEALVRIAA